MLRAVEKPRTPTPEAPAALDVSNVPADVIDAMKLDESLYQPILEAFHELLAERMALQEEYARVTASQAQTEQCFQEQSLTRSADTRDSRLRFFPYVCVVCTWFRCMGPGIQHSLSLIHI